MREGRHDRIIVGTSLFRVAENILKEKIIMELVEYRIHHNQEFLIFKKGKASIKTIIQDKSGHYAGVRQRLHYAAACTETDVANIDISRKLITDAACQLGNRAEVCLDFREGTVDPFACNILTDLWEYKEFLEQIFQNIKLSDDYEIYLEIRGILAEKRILSVQKQFENSVYCGTYFSATVSDVEKPENMASHTCLYHNEINAVSIVERLVASVRWNRRYGIVHCTPGYYDCILHPQAAAVMVHEAVGHAMEADVAYGPDGQAQREITRVNEKITVIDFAHHAFGHKTPVPVYIDDEGIGSTDTVLIKNGKIDSYMNNRQYAEEYFNGIYTGNARAHFYKDIPVIRMRNTALMPGIQLKENMFAAIRDGLYLTKVKSGQADTGGRFTFQVEEGYQIKNGNPTYAIRGNSVVGNMHEFLNNITDLSDDFIWLEGRLCSKKQVIPVSMGGPYVQCRLFVL